MSAFWIGNTYLLVGLLCASFSHILFKSIFNDTGPLNLHWSSVYILFSYGRGVRVFLALGLLVVGFVLWMMSLSRLDISYAYPIASASALLVTFFSVLFLGEAVSVRSWCGTVLIVLGTALLVPSR